MKQSRDEMVLELAMDIQHGETHLFNKLHNEIRPDIMRYMRRRVAIKADAEDLTQNVLIKVNIQLAAGLYRGLKFFAWLYAIMKTEVYLYYQRRKRLQYADVEISETADCGAGEAEAYEELCTEPETAMQNLPPQRRFIMTEFLINDRPYREIADEIGKSTGYVTSAVCKGLEDMAEMMNGAAKSMAMRYREKKSAQRRSKTQRGSVYIDESNLLMSRCAD